MVVIFDLLILTFVQLISLFGILIVVGCLIHIIERQSVKFIYKSFGLRGLLVTSWIGTPIHEFGHYLMCKIFNHQVIAVQWFPKDQHASVLGFVEHRYNSRSLYQKIGVFFISIGPLFSGLLALSLLLYVLLPNSFNTFVHFTKSIEPASLTLENIALILTASFEMISTIFTLDNVTSIRFWTFLLLAACICTHISLSPADLRGAFSGLMTIAIILFTVNSIAIFIGFNTSTFISTLAAYNAYLIGWMGFVLCMSIMTLVLTFMISFIKRRKFLRVSA
ncbi:MAG: hypothetical protein ACI33M_04310 [Lysinibacillus sp.]